MNTLRQMTRIVIEQVVGIKDRLLQLIQTAIRQLAALLTRPLQYIQPDYADSEPRFPSPTRGANTGTRLEDEPEDDEYARVKRASVEADQELMAVILEWKAAEIVVRDAKLARKQFSWTEEQELWALKDIALDAEDRMINALHARINLHVKHCDLCQNITEAQCKTVALVRQPTVSPTPAAEDKHLRPLLAIEYNNPSAEELPPVDEPASNALLALTYEPLQDIHEHINASRLRALPAPAIFNKIKQMLPCQDEKKRQRFVKSSPRYLKSGNAVKKSSQSINQRPRWR